MDGSDGRNYCDLLEALRDHGRGGHTEPDFIAKTGIAKKEAKESVFWLRLLAATAPRSREKIQPLLREANEIAAIVTTIKKNAEENLRREKEERRKRAAGSDGKRAGNTSEHNPI